MKKTMKLKDWNDGDGEDGILQMLMKVDMQRQLAPDEGFYAECIGS
jgi:hypothetical protein